MYGSTWCSKTGLSTEVKRTSFGEQSGLFTLLQRIMDSKLEQPLISPHASIPAPRLLDRDGTFSQSRGRWRVSNSASRARFGSARQRCPVADSFGTPVGGDGGASPFEVLPPRSERPNTSRPPLWYRLCCRCYKSDDQSGIIPRRCWDDWFRKFYCT